MVNFSLNDIAYDYIEIYRANLRNTDEIDIREMYFWIHTNRAKLIKQRLDKPMSKINEHWVQGLGTITLEKVDSSIYSSTISSGKYMLRTTIDIPSTIERSGHIGTFTRIGPADRLQERFKVVDQETALVSGSGKFNKDFVYAFPLDQRIYLVSRNPRFLMLKYIDIRGVFQNPVQAALIADPTWNENSNYPISADIVEDMKGIVLGKEFKLSHQNPIDPVPVNPELIQKEE